MLDKIFEKFNFTYLFDNEILIDAFCTEAMPANCGLTFVNEFETKGANQRLEILLRVKI
jgi:hypothetical protein